METKIDNEIEMARRRIISHAKWLSKRAESILEQAEHANPYNCNFNSLGELQGNGVEMDRLIVVFETMKMAKKCMQEEQRSRR